MKLAIFTDVRFFNSLNKLITVEYKPIRVAYKCNTIKDFLHAEFKKYEALRLELVNKYAEKNEKGEIKKLDNGAAIFTEENEVLFSKEFVDLTNIEFALPQTISLGEIEQIENILKQRGLSPAVLGAEDLKYLGELITP